MEGCDEAPAADAEGDVDVWWDESVHEGHPFEESVCDVECGQEPFVLPRREIQVVGQSGDFCISNVYQFIISLSPARNLSM